MAHTECVKINLRKAAMIGCGFVVLQLLLH